MEVSSRGIPLNKKKFLLKDSARSGFTHRNVELFLDNGQLVAGDEFDAPPPSDRLHPGEGDVSPGDTRSNYTDLSNQPATQPQVQTVNPSDTINLNQQTDNANQYDSNKSILYVQGNFTQGNVLTNPSFETWSGGVNAAPDGWTLAGAGAAVAREGTIIKVGTYSAKLTRNGSDCYLYNSDYANFAGLGTAYWKGRTITLGCWVYSSGVRQVYIDIYDGITETISSHSVATGWEYLTVTKTISTSATRVEFLLGINTADTTAYFDGASVTENSPYILSSNPQISPSFQGDLCTVQWAGLSLILQNGNGLRLYSLLIRIDSGTQLNLIYDSTGGVWCETSRMGPNFALQGVF